MKGRRYHDYTAAGNTGRNAASVESDRRVARLEAQLRSNEQIWSGFRQIEISIIGARSLGQVIGTLAEGIRRQFPRVDCVTLACCDPDYEIERILAADENNRLPPGAFISISLESLQTIFPKGLRPRLGPIDVSARTILFPAYDQPLGSMALAPLVLHGKLIGCLSQGSQSTRHFTQDIATDLLGHLAAVTTMCVENAVNHERLKQDGLTDPLTGVSNRRFFERRLAEEVDRWLRRGEPLSCMVADIDLFKTINDRYGHQAGDQVLKQVAVILGQDLRASDVLARYGGEEFVFLLPNTLQTQAAEIAERMRAAVARVVHIEKADNAGVTVSIGVACLEPGRRLPDTQPGDWLFKEADKAMYRAKQEGRNKVVVSE